MKVILTENVKKVGVRGQLVDVADGYAQNVLLPQKKALPGTAENIKKYEQTQSIIKSRAEQDATSAREALKQIDGKSVTIVAKASETGTLFKSLHASDIKDAIQKEWGIDVPESAIQLDEPLKKKGTHVVPVELLGSKAKLEVII